MSTAVDIRALRVRPKKKYCLFPISDRPYQNMCDPKLFYGFPPKKKNEKKKEIHKLRDELLAVVKVAKKRYEKERRGKKTYKKQKLVT